MWFKAMCIDWYKKTFQEIVPGFLSFEFMLNVKNYNKIQLSVVINFLLKFDLNLEINLRIFDLKIDEIFRQSVSGRLIGIFG